MIAGLKPYLEYKESGLPWLGRIPAHWREWRLDRLFELRKEAPLPEDQRVTAYLNGRVTLRTNVQGQKIKGVVKEAGWQRVHPGDFAISGMNAHLGGMGVSDSLGKCSPIYLVLKPKLGTNAHFVSHAVRHIAHMGALKSFVNTIRFNSADFKRDSLKLFRVLLPSEYEQAAIVRFLDHANGRIERVIRTKKKLIELLNEQKQAMIHRAVTRGLDPNVPLKHSGIDWLGGLPDHWEVQRLKTVARITMGQSPPSDECNIDGEGRPFLQGCAEFGDRYPIPVQFCPTAPKVSPAESILLSVRAPVGALNIADREYGIGRGLCAVEPFRSHLDLEFTLHAIAMTKGQLLMIATGSTYDAVTVGEVGCIRLPLPPLAEQRQIADHVRVETQAIDTAIGRAKREIELLREHRTRLVADVVTGKLDVGEAAKGLLSKAEEPAIEVESEEKIEDEVTTGEE
jgi:type I restriction enzyme S subunit